MEPTAALRLLLVYAHLLLCVFALHRVLDTDWRVLRGRMHHLRLERTHKLLLWLLAGLWCSGLAIIALDTGFDGAALAQRPKLLAKLVCVSLLTLNGALLRGWCFPRLVAGAPLGRIEAMVLMACGSVSTASWLMAAFYGVARALQGWPLARTLDLYWAALAVATLAALPLAARLRRGRRAEHAQVRQMRGGSAARSHAS